MRTGTEARVEHIEEDGLKKTLFSIINSRGLTIEEVSLSGHLWIQEAIDGLLDGTTKRVGL